MSKDDKKQSKGQPKSFSQAMAERDGPEWRHKWAAKLDRMIDGDFS